MLYVPRAFRFDENKWVELFLQENHFGILLSQTETFPLTTHLPFFYDPTVGEKGTLFSHLAIQNPHVTHLRAHPEAMVIFSGPHTYISPTWIDHKHVPTWNYTVLNVYGLVKLITEEEIVKRVLTQLVTQYEGETGWQTDFNQQTQSQLLKAIQVIAIDIQKFEGKLKLSQNRTALEQEKIQTQLMQHPHQTAQAVGQWMQRIKTD